MSTPERDRDTEIRGLENFAALAQGISHRLDQAYNEVLQDEVRGRHPKELTKPLRARFAAALACTEQAEKLAQDALLRLLGTTPPQPSEEERKLALYAPLNPWLIERTGHIGAEIFEIHMQTYDTLAMDYGVPDVRRTSLYVCYRVDGHNFDPMGQAYVWEAIDEQASEVMTALLEHTLTLMRG